MTEKDRKKYIFYKNLFEIKYNEDDDMIYDYLLNIFRTNENLDDLEIIIDILKNEIHFPFNKMRKYNGNFEIPTLLFQSILYTNLDVVKLLVEKAKVNVNRYSDSTYNPLMASISTDNSDIAVYLIEHGANSTVLLGFKIPLLEATMFNLENVIDAIIRHNGDINIRDPFKKTALLLAFELYHLNIAENLINHNATINDSDLLDIIEYWKQIDNNEDLSNKYIELLSLLLNKNPTITIPKHILDANPELDIRLNEQILVKSAYKFGGNNKLKKSKKSKKSKSKKYISKSKSKKNKSKYL